MGSSLASDPFDSPLASSVDLAQSTAPQTPYLCRFQKVIEVVSDSPEDRRRDYQEKRDDYAEAQIAEYWIVDPKERKLTVLALDGAVYREHGAFTEGDTATSACFPDLEVTVSELFAKCEK